VDVDRATFESLLGQYPAAGQAFDGVCGLCSQILNKPVSHLTHEALEALYSSDTYTACSDTVTSGDRLIQKALEYFHKFDTSGDGQIHESELRAMIREMVSPEDLSHAGDEDSFTREVAQIMSQLDTDHNGDLDREEFVTGLLRLTSNRAPLSSNLHGFNQIYLSVSHSSTETFVR